MIEVLKQALEALEFFSDTSNSPMDKAMSEDAITSLRQAIAELESQESQIKTTDSFESAKVKDYNRGWNDCFFASGIVKQSQRTWVGLTDEDCEEVERWVEFKEEGSGRIPMQKLARYIEAKLKEKNCL